MSVKRQGVAAEEVGLAAQKKVSMKVGREIIGVLG